MSSDKVKQPKVDRTKFKDSMGRYLTQGLFLEYAYDPTFAIYTVDGHDREYKGKTYYSLKKRYLNEEDVHEFKFATNHLADWEHWQRLLQNKWCFKHISMWREELEVKLASYGVQKVLDLAEDGNFQAAKFVAERQWSKKRGRPSKEEIMRKSRIDERIANEFEEDAERVGLIN